MTAQEVLTKAADLIEQAPKLAREAFQVKAWQLDDDGYVVVFDLPDDADLSRCYCAIGAIRQAAIDTVGGDCYGGDYYGATYALTRVITGEPAGDIGSAERSVYAWNDDPDRTKAEVVAALRKAAEQ